MTRSLNLGNLPKAPMQTSSNYRTSVLRSHNLTTPSQSFRHRGTHSRIIPRNLKNDEERAVKALYAKVLGSAVNPVLREGNSDRRVADAVKQFAKDNPHSMGAWACDSKTHVAHMRDGDYYSSEQSHVCSTENDVRIEHVDANGTVTVLKQSTPVQAGEVIDSSVMSRAAIRGFFEEEIEAAKDQGVLLSLHLKATMMKVSDPIFFGHCVEVYYRDVFEKHAAVFEQIGVESSNGIGDVYSKIKDLADEVQNEIRTDIDAVYFHQTRTGNGGF